MILSIGIVLILMAAYAVSVCTAIVHEGSCCRFGIGAGAIGFESWSTVPSTTGAQVIPAGSWYLRVVRDATLLWPEAGRRRNVWCIAVPLWIPLTFALTCIVIRRFFVPIPADSKQSGMTNL